MRRKARLPDLLPPASLWLLDETMSVLELTDEQVLSLVRQLPPPSKKAALLALAEDANRRRDERVAYAEQQLRLRARERGLNWDSMTEDEREAFVNRLLHEA
jgi:hypothetical protein